MLIYILILVTIYSILAVFAWPGYSFSILCNKKNYSSKLNTKHFWILFFFNLPPNSECNFIWEERARNSCCYFQINVKFITNKKISGQNDYHKLKHNHKNNKKSTKPQSMTVVLIPTPMEITIFKDNKMVTPSTLSEYANGVSMRNDSWVWKPIIWPIVRNSPRNNHNGFPGKPRGSRSEGIYS